MTVRQYRKVFSITLGRDIAERAKSVALNEGMAFSRWIEEAIESKLKDSDHEDLASADWFKRRKYRERADKRMAARRKKSGLD